MQRNKLYFISDCHFGVPNHNDSLVREKELVAFLESIKTDAKALYLLGDIFDFWFEYKYVVPKGYVRLLGKLAELTDLGVEVHYLIGNHDMWAFSYFEKEMNVKMHRKPIEFEYSGKKFFIAHGDGLGPGDHKYKFLKMIFSAKINQRLFAMVHPWISFSIARFFSKHSRLAHQSADFVYLGDDNERLLIFAKEKLKTEHYDYFIFGHRHLTIDMQAGENSRYINLGEWVHERNYAMFDGENLYLKSLEKK